MKTTGIIFIIIGVVSILIQNTFYGYIDAGGVMQDSIFLPVGALATIFGLALLVAWGGVRLLRSRV